MKLLKLFHKRDRIRQKCSHSLFAFFKTSGSRKASPVEDLTAQYITVKEEDDKETVKDDKEMKLDGDQVWLPHAITREDEYVFIRHPIEPEMVPPVRCPRPEPGVIQDGRTLKERAPARIGRKGQLPFLTESQMQINSLWKHRTSLSDGQICATANAPETSLRTSLP